MAIRVGVSHAVGRRLPGRGEEGYHFGGWPLLTFHSCSFSRPIFFLCVWL